MKKNEIVSPKLGKDGFNCPHCGAFTQQQWGWMGVYPKDRGGDWSMVAHNIVQAKPVGEHVQLAICTKCKGLSFWISAEMAFPDVTAVDLPNEDLSDGIKADYKEAASVLQKSPRAAAALLRLALQKLCKQLGGKGKSIHDDIGLLIKAGLPESVMKAMDAVRIIGNNAVHPGQLDMDDNAEIAAKLFRLINFIAEKTITDKREVDEIYKGLPNSEKQKDLGDGE